MNPSSDYRTADPLNYQLLKEFAKNNRKYPTEAESILWDCLKGNSLGKPFRRQHIIGNYIVDFLCLPARLVIELDGMYHQLPQQMSDDNMRSEWLSEHGYKVIRFRNEEVIDDTDSVLQRIKKHL